MKKVFIFLVVLAFLFSSCMLMPRRMTIQDFLKKYENGEISKSFLKDIKDIQLIQKPTKEELTMLNDLPLWLDVDNNYSLKCLIFGKAAEMVIYHGEDEEGDFLRSTIFIQSGKQSTDWNIFKQILAVAEKTYGKATNYEIDGEECEQADIARVIEADECTDISVFWEKDQLYISFSYSEDSDYSAVYVG